MRAPEGKGSENVARHYLQINNTEIYGNSSLAAQFSMNVKTVHFYIRLCVHVRIHACSGIRLLMGHVYTKVRVNLGFHSSGATHTGFLRQGLSLVWRLTGSLNWLGRKPQEYLSLPTAPGTGNTSLCHRTQISYIIVKQVSTLPTDIPPHP